MAAVASQIDQLLNLLAPLISAFSDPEAAIHLHDEDACDFTTGNSFEMPNGRFVEAIQKWSAPQSHDWFAYKMNESPAQTAVGNTLRARFNLPFRDEDIHLTNGGFAALTVAFKTVIDPGDEVIFISPPFFFYEAQIVASGATPVRVRVNPETFDLDVEAIAAAITPKTRAILINSPHNPTGKIYPEATLRQLGQVLTEASERNGRPIYLVSDEAYSRIIYDGSTFVTPTAYYPNSLIAYTYGKILLIPGERIGYLAVAPGMADRDHVNMAVMVAQMMTGYAFPNAILQYALPELESASIDIEHLQEKRDRLVSALREIGYGVHAPEGTFFLLPQAPIADDTQFVRLLAQQKIFCMPGQAMEMPGYFRLSLTATDAMIERSLAGFAQARQQAVALA
jgi:aspartate aminotransferase